MISFVYHYGIYEQPLRYPSLGSTSVYNGIMASSFIVDQTFNVYDSFNYPKRFEKKSLIASNLLDRNSVSFSVHFSLGYTNSLNTH